MTLIPPDNPDAFSERLPVMPTITIDRDTNAGLSEAVERACYYTDMTTGEARRAIVAGIREVRAGDVVTVSGVRVHVR